MQGTVNERLKFLIDALGTNPNALARILGISASTLRNYTDRESKPGYEVLEKLYHSFKHINLYWLFGESGEPLLPIAGEATIEYQSSKKNSGNIIGSITGDKNRITTLADCQLENAGLRKENEQLRSQLADKDHLIQSKQEIIDLLKQAK